MFVIWFVGNCTQGQPGTAVVVRVVRPYSFALGRYSRSSRSGRSAWIEARRAYVVGL